ncbi:hypothetical protein CCP4SC76_2330002 [Gammaproteobacteria bacterium]
MVTFDAEQLAVDPPLLPLHDQYHGPEPLTEEAVPALQRPLVGVLVNDWPLDEPQAPFVPVYSSSTSDPERARLWMRTSSIVPYQFLPPATHRPNVSNCVPS